MKVSGSTLVQSRFKQIFSREKKEGFSVRGKQTNTNDVHFAGYQLYLTLTNDDVLLEVEKSSRILWYYIFTYGLAFLIVTIAIAIDPYVYTRADYCVWMEQTSVFYSTFIAPIIIFILVSAP